LADQTQRNILFLFTDQHRRDTLGCYGSPICRTPALDGLAAEGVRFDHAYTPTAICTPARATLVTGMLPFRHGLITNPETTSGERGELDERLRPFSADLREAGYDVGLIGKWHVGRLKGPREYGFEGEHYPRAWNPLEHPDYLSYLEERGLPPVRLTTEVFSAFPNGRADNLIAGVLDQPGEATFEYFLAERVIERLHQYARGYHEDGRPFFLGGHWFGPHLPYIMPPDFYDLYDPADVLLPASMAETFFGKPRVQQQYSAYWGFDSFSPDEWRKLIAVYWGYVTLIDEQIGRVLQTVKDLGLWDSTAVIFSTDHGSFTGAHRLEDKGPAMYDDIYRIPFIARLPGMTTGRIEERFITLTDLTPTFLDLAGLTAPPHYDGRSILPVVRGEDVQDWPREVVTEFHGLQIPYAQRMIRTDRFKLVINAGDVCELYDLATDPDELLNQYEHPELAAVRHTLLRRLYEVLVARGDPFATWVSRMHNVTDEASPTIWVG
jgi:arylsulfatase A-like enzyme